MLIEDFYRKQAHEAWLISDGIMQLEAKYPAESERGKHHRNYLIAHYTRQAYLFAAIAATKS